MSKSNRRTGEKPVTNRDARGRFVAGNRANPGGRPKADKEIKEALKALVPQSIEVLKQIIANEDARDQDRIRAIEVVFDRVYGKPSQEMKLDEITADKTLVMRIEGLDDYAG